MDAHKIKEWVKQRIEQLETKKNKSETREETLEALYMMTTFFEVIKFINTTV